MIDKTLKFLKYFILLFVFLAIVGCAASHQEKLYYVAPTQIPHTNRLMKTAGFWIGQHPFPDRVILNPDEIQEFNRVIREELKLTRDLSQYPSETSGKELRNTLKKVLDKFSQQDLYLDYLKASAQFYRDMMDQMNMDAIPETIKVKFGFVVHLTDHRFFPTTRSLYAKPEDIDFDELQNSTLDVGRGVAILHQSRDKKWYYVETSLTSGWARVEDIALTDQEKIKELIQEKNPVVAISAKADIFLDSQMTKPYDYVRMGARFLPESTPSVNNPDAVAIMLPTRDDQGHAILRTAYMNAAEVHQGYLTYSPRTIIEQAFKLLNAPYGWGGMNGEQDCSRFIQEVFATTGVFLPRNSTDQKKVGHILAEFKEGTPLEGKINLLNTQAVGATTLLYLKGHNMLFLGTVDKNPYAIHATWAYRERGPGADIVRVLNRVVVSDLSLGEGSRKGSLLKRLLVVNHIGN